MSESKSTTSSVMSATTVAQQQCLNDCRSLIACSKTGEEKKIAELADKLFQTCCDTDELVNVTLDSGVVETIVILIKDAENPKRERTTTQLLLGILANLSAKSKGAQMIGSLGGLDLGAKMMNMVVHHTRSSSGMIRLVGNIVGHCPHLVTVDHMDTFVSAVSTSSIDTDLLEEFAYLISMIVDQHARVSTNSIDKAIGFYPFLSAQLRLFSAGGRGRHAPMILNSLSKLLILFKGRIVVEENLVTRLFDMVTDETKTMQIIRNIVSQLSISQSGVKSLVVEHRLLQVLKTGSSLYITGVVCNLCTHESGRQWVMDNDAFAYLLSLPLEDNQKLMNARMIMMCNFYANSESDSKRVEYFNRHDCLVHVTTLLTHNLVKPFLSATVVEHVTGLIRRAAAVE